MEPISRKTYIIVIHFKGVANNFRHKIKNIIVFQDVEILSYVFNMRYLDFTIFFVLILFNAKNFLYSILSLIPILPT